LHTLLSFPLVAGSMKNPINSGFQCWHGDCIYKSSSLKRSFPGSKQAVEGHSPKLTAVAALIPTSHTTVVPRDSDSFILLSHSPFTERSNPEYAWSQHFHHITRKILHIFAPHSRGTRNPLKRSSHFVPGFFKTGGLFFSPLPLVFQPPRLFLDGRGKRPLG